MYKEELLDKPAVLALNKIDKDGSQEKLEEIMEKISNLEGKLTPETYIRKYKWSLLTLNQSGLSSRAA